MFIVPYEQKKMTKYGNCYFAFKNLKLNSNYGCRCPKNNFDLNKIDTSIDSDSTRTTGNPIQSFFVSTNLPEFTRVKTVD